MTKLISQISQDGRCLIKAEENKTILVLKKKPSRHHERKERRETKRNKNLYEDEWLFN